MSIELFLNAIGKLQHVEQTDNGLLVKTHCMYPSLERVIVVVNSRGTGDFVISDGGKVSEEFHHLGEEMLTKVLGCACEVFGVGRRSGALFSEANHADDIATKVLFVANASAFAAFTALEYEAAT